MPRLNGLNSGNNPDDDDRLLVLREDGGIIEDKHVRQEHGLTISDRLMAAQVANRPIPLVTWERVDEPPLESGILYLWDDEPKRFSDLSEHEGILDSVFNKALLGQTQPQQAKRRRGIWLRSLWVISVAIVFVVAFALVPAMKKPQIVTVPDAYIEQLLQERQLQEQEKIEADLLRLYEQQKRLEEQGNEPTPSPQQ